MTTRMLLRPAPAARRLASDAPSLSIQTMTLAPTTYSVCPRSPRPTTTKRSLPMRSIFPRNLSNMRMTHTRRSWTRKPQSLCAPVAAAAEAAVPLRRLLLSLRPCLLDRACACVLLPTPPLS